MYCRKCGNKLEQDSKFCDKCGTKVEVVEQDKEVVEKSSSIKENTIEKDEALDITEKPFVVKDKEKVGDKKKQLWNIVIIAVLAIVLVVEMIAYVPIKSAKEMSEAYDICIHNKVEDKEKFVEIWGDLQENTAKKEAFVKAVRVRAEEIYLSTEEDVTIRLQQLQALQTWGVVDTTYFQEQLQAEVFCNHLVNGSLDVAVASLTGISESLLNRYKTSSFQKGEELYQQYLQEAITYEAFLAYIQNLQACNILNYPIVDWSQRLTLVSANRVVFFQAQEQYTQKNYYEAFTLLNGLSLHQDDVIYNEKIEALKSSIIAEAKPHYIEMVNAYLANGDKDSSADIYKKLKEMYGTEDAEVKTIVNSLVEDWKMAYLEKLRELENTEVSTVGGTGCYKQFYLKELFNDGDGIPELIVFAPLDSWGRIKIFSYQNGLEEINFGNEEINVSAVYYNVQGEGALIFAGGRGPRTYYTFEMAEKGKHEMVPGATGSRFSAREAYWQGEGGVDNEAAEEAFSIIDAFTQKDDMINFYNMKEKNYKKYLELGDLDL